MKTHVHAYTHTTYTQGQRDLLQWEAAIRSPSMLRCSFSICSYSHLYNKVALSSKERTFAL